MSSKERRHTHILLKFAQIYSKFSHLKFSQNSQILKFQLKIHQKSQNSQNSLRVLTDSVSIIKNSKKFSPISEGNRDEPPLLHLHNYPRPSHSAIISVIILQLYGLIYYMVKCHHSSHDLTWLGRVTYFLHDLTWLDSSLYQRDLTWLVTWPNPDLPDLWSALSVSVVTLPR